MSQVLKRKYAKLVDYKKFLNTDAGKSVLRDLMDAHYLFRSTFDRDSNEMARKEGERNVVLRLLSILNITPQQMEDFAKEIEKDARSESTSSSDRDNGPRINW